MMDDVRAASTGPDDLGPVGAADRAYETTPALAGLLRRCARGDEEAFARLYDATARRLYDRIADKTPFIVYQKSL